MHDRTALAEAEVEYEMHTSPSVYVRYRLTSPPEGIDVRLAGKRVWTIIWTTTPWTLPASLAVAFHPEFEYVALEQDGEVYIVAEALAAATTAACSLESAQEIARFPGSRMERVTFAHPFLDRTVLGVLATYVTTDQGTGAVHTAPAHGVDDFATGARYGLSQLCDVDEGGRLRHGLPEYDGLYVFKANETDHRLAGCTSRADGAAGGVSLLSALLALPQPGYFPGHGAVVYPHGNPHDARGWLGDQLPRACAGGDRAREVGPRMGPGAHHQHGRLASRLVHLAAADLGRADRGLSLRKTAAGR